MEEFDKKIDERCIKIKHINLNDDFETKKNISTYYYTRAIEYHSCALLLFHVLSDKEPRITRIDIGFSDDFSFGVTLRNPLEMNMGYSIELLLKAIIVLLGIKFKNIHDLTELINSTGIKLNDDQNVILENISHGIKWAARYPAPKTLEEWTANIDSGKKAMEFVDGQSEFQIMRPNPKRMYSVENYKDIWDTLSKCYLKAKDKINEP